MKTKGTWKERTSNEMIIIFTTVNDAITHILIFCITFKLKLLIIYWKSVDSAPARYKSGKNKWIKLNE